MKFFPLVLAGSLAVNATLIAMIIAGSWGEPTPTALRPHDASSDGATSISGAPSAISSEAWADLHSDDLATHRDRLRAAGFPPELVRAILGAQVRESFAARRKALEDAPGEVPFWKMPNRDPKIQAALRDLGREQEKILKDLLGRDARDDDPSYAAYLRRQFGELPAEKVEQLRQILDDYNRQRSEIFTNARNGLLPEEQQKLTALDKAMRADYAAVLTPEELADYNLRSSPTADNLRSNLTAFDATEQEYRALFQIQQAFDERFGRMYGPVSPEDLKARSDAQKQLNDDIKVALGDQRYADYKRATDYSYRQTNQLVARLELPQETANQVYAVLQDIQQRAATLRRNNSLSRDDRTLQLTALADEAAAKVTTALGPQGFEAYKQYGGQWLQTLVPRPPPLAPKN